MKSRDEKPMKGIIFKDALNAHYIPNNQKQS